MGIVKGAWAKVAGQVEWPFLQAQGREMKAFGSKYWDVCSWGWS